MSAPARAWVEIDLATLERNLTRVRAALPSHIAYVAVVKADAYGHGLQPTVSRLMHAGADLFAVANIREAAAIREIGSGWPILVLSALLPGEEQACFDYDLIATLSSQEELERFEKASEQAGRPLTVHLKVDTGMGRLGVWHEEAEGLLEVVQQSAHVRLGGVFTHFSHADSDAAFTEAQRQRFLNILKSIPEEARAKLLVHADNSAGIGSFPVGGPLNAVRVGLLQFGIRPYKGSILHHTLVEPVLSFHTRVGLVKNLPTGTAISYGRTHTLARPSRVAILTAGYGDGIPTAMSNRGQVLIGGQRCSILGRVTMDQTIVDVTDLPSIAVGDQATLIGQQGDGSIDAVEYAQTANEIPWETFCSITKRVERVYRMDTKL